MTSRAPRTSMSSSIGRLSPRARLADGTPVQLHVPQPQHQEVDFWLCTCSRGENDEHFFGPRAA